MIAGSLPVIVTMSSPTDPLDRLVLLEQVFSYQEQLVQQLNQVMIQLRDELDALKQKYDKQTAQIEWLIQNLPVEGRSLEDDKPPHY